MDEQVLKELLETFTNKLGVVVSEIEVIEVSGNKIFNIKSDDSKRFIGPKGEHLRAFNFILRRYIEKQNDAENTHFLVDVNGYQMRHIRDIEQKAKLLADRVRTFRSNAEMTPMNAYERMVVHSLFSNDPEIVTESEGVGKMRRVVLRYNENKNTP